MDYPGEPSLTACTLRNEETPSSDVRLAAMTEESERNPMLLTLKTE